MTQSNDLPSKKKLGAVQDAIARLQIPQTDLTALGKHAQTFQNSLTAIAQNPALSRFQEMEKRLAADAKRIREMSKFHDSATRTIDPFDIHKRSLPKISENLIPMNIRNPVDDLSKSIAKREAQKSKETKEAQQKQFELLGKLVDTAISQHDLMATIARANEAEAKEASENIKLQKKTLNWAQIAAFLAIASLLLSAWQIFHP